MDILSWSLSHGPGIAVTSVCGHCRRSLNMTSSAGFPPSVGGSQAGLWFHKMSSGPINRNLTAMLTIDNVLADLIRMPIHIGSLISSFLFQTPGVFTYVARIMPSSSWWQHDDTDHDDQLIWAIYIYRYRGPVRVFDHHVSGDHLWPLYPGQIDVIPLGP